MTRDPTQKAERIRVWLGRAAARILPGHGFARSITVLAGGAALGQGVALLASPILTRLYSPEDYGVLGVYAAILGMITVVASLRYEYALPLPEDDATAANVLAVCLLLLCGTVALASILVLCWGREIVRWVDAPALERYLWLLPLGMLGAGAYQILNYWTVRKRNFSRLAGTRITRGAGRAVIQIGMGLTHVGPLGLVLGQIAGETAGTASLARAAWRGDRATLREVNPQRMWAAAKRYRRFPLLSGSADVLDGLVVQLPQLLFAAFYGIKVAGWFSLGQGVIAAPLSIVVDSVSQVLFGEAARLARDDLRSMRRLFLKLIARLALLGGLPVVAICVLAPWFFTVVFGPGWEEAGRYVQVMGIMFAARTAVIPSAQLLNILERQDLYFLWDAIRLALVVGTLIAGKVLGVAPVTSVTLYSLSMAVAYAFLAILVWIALRGRSRPPEAQSSDKP